jgi:hypothetical protein
LRFKQVDGCEQIGNQNDHAPFANGGGDLLQRRCQIGLGAGGRALQRDHEPPQVARSIAGRYEVANLLIEGDQAGRVALSGQEVSQRRRCGAGVFDFGILA